MATVAKDFSIEEKLTAVLTLQKIDSKRDEIKTLKGELPMEVSDLEDEVEGLQTRANNIDSEIASIGEYIESRKTAKKDAEALIKKYEKQQDNVKNSREFEAITKEMEMQELEMKLCDKHIKDAGVRLQEAQHTKLQSQGLLEGKIDALNAKKEELDKIIKETEKEENELTKNSEKAKEKVEERLLTAYERIRTSYRNGLAVVPVLRDSCGGCFNIIPPQRQAEIHQRKKIIVCEHCGRILVDNDLNESVKI
ncbi:zinc ribbon domain-containing protein [Taibaiella koreensis]|uniref:zinc ribbon domain-containing protein n=1 Tax=Taibaiella koreensis TaxID=1268548 RepID=UPI000E59E2E6|nr:C4-type zinc ribbon domain-containing protein [Taibaiella koreensis]